MTWFEQLVGFEENQINIDKYLTVYGEYLVSAKNKSKYKIGKLSMPSLELLRINIDTSRFSGSIRTSETVSDVSTLINDPKNANSVFQVASQFNLLEMATPEYTPEMGVSIYEFDNTQGPKCAICCGAGTIYRNYFVPIGNQFGQSSVIQLNTLDLAEDFIFGGKNPWSMYNGYLQISNENWEHLQQKSSSNREKIGNLIKVGVQKNIEVTSSPTKHCITQVFCSACPLSYSNIKIDRWAPFFNIVLDSIYESTFLVAIENLLNTGNNKLFLTLVGGGAFGNPENCILSSIAKCLRKFRFVPLEVYIVSYRYSNPNVNKLIASL